MAARLRVYSRPDCHLCDEMIQALDPLQIELGFDVEKIDVDARDEDRTRYGRLIPVLVDQNGQIICNHRLDEQRLRRHLALE